MKENINKVTEDVQFSMCLYSYLRIIHVQTARARNDYNIHPYKILSKITLCILITLLVEIRQ
jgi:hypothetical protein